MNSGPHSTSGLLNRVVSGGVLSSAETEFVFEEMLHGRMGHGEIVALLKGIAARGVTVDELVGGATAMRRHATVVPVPAGMQAQVIDTCGTGGAPKLFNVSTIAAIVAAGAGAKVVKHGNRSRTGRGSAEILQSLGVNVDAGPEVQARCLTEAGLCFCFAIHHHPATKNAGPARKEIGTPTIFNMLGPLTNPGRATRQMLGVARPEQVELMAGALARLGCTRAMVVHSVDGFDELSTTGENLVGHVEGASVRMERLDPSRLGLLRVRAEELQAGSLEEATGIVREVLSGKAGAKTEIVVLNAGAAMFVAGAARDLAEGIKFARDSIASGTARATLDQLARASAGK